MEAEEKITGRWKVGRCNAEIGSSWGDGQMRRHQDIETGTQTTPREGGGTGRICMAGDDHGR